MLDPSHTMDREEAAECEKMQEIQEMPGMEGNFRWIVAQVGRGGRARVCVWRGGGGSQWLVICVCVCWCWGGVLKQVALDLGVGVRVGVNKLV